MARAEKVVKKTSAASVQSPSTGRIGKTTDIESVRMLVQLMVDNELNEINIKDADVRVHLKRGVVSSVSTAAASVAVPAAPAPAAPAAGEPESAGEDVIEIKSPMVGTSYTKPNPKSPPFVKVGDHVDSEKTICIIEAMKVFNEIPAEVSGRIIAVLVQDEEPVEFGKPLFKVDTKG